MERPTITHNIHYMWLTDPENPIEAPLSHLTYVTDSMAAFRNGTKYNDWNYQFHTNTPYSISNTTNFFISLGFKIRDITSEYNEFQTGGFIDVFIKSKKYGLATDLARYEIVNNDGGIYLDLNFNLTRALDHEVCAYSYVGLYRMHIANNRPIDVPAPENYFFVSRPNHPILTQTISDIFNPFHDTNSKIYWDALNEAHDGLTHTFFEKFSLNNILNLTSNGEPGIIYTFIRGHDNGDNHKYTSTTLETTIESLSYNPAKYRKLLDKIKEVMKQNPPKFVCTNSDFVSPIGEDSMYGGSWSSNVENKHTDTIVILLMKI